MKRLVPAFGVPLILAVGLGQGDTRLPALSPLAPKLRVAPLPQLLLPSVPPPRAPGDVIPHAYMVYGLRTGPGGTAFTDRNGVALPVPSNPQIILKPFNGYSAIPPPFVPRTFTLPLPAPKK